jgi:hypothetical protein
MLFMVLVIYVTIMFTGSINLSAATSIKPGVQWYDTSGHEINCLGGLVFYNNGTYYWVGTDFANKSQNLYSSTDLMNWTFRKAILTPSSHSDVANAYWCARPSLFYSAANNRWVLYVEWQTQDMGTGNNDLGWATCSTIDGNYTWQGHFKPGGYPFHDASLYSESGKNYFITSNWDGGGADGAIWEIGSNDKPGTMITYWNISGEIEGTHLFKRNGYYYWIGSEKAGWRGSKSKFIKATSMTGLKNNSGYTTLSYSGPGSDTGFDSQCDFVLPIAGSSTYMLCKDKWSYFNSALGTGDQVWLPLQWNGDTPYVVWYDSWTPGTSNPTPTSGGFATPTPTPSSGSYKKIRNVATGLYIDGMGRTSNGSNAGQYASSTSYNQEWTLEAVGSYYKIRNRGTGLYLDGMGRTSSGSIVGQYAGSSSNNQQWIRETSGSYYKFKNRATGLYIDGAGATSNGADLKQYGNSSSNNQKWQIQ